MHGVKSDLPSHWSPMEDPKTAELVSLAPGSAERLAVETAFFQTASSQFAVLDVQRRQHVALWRLHQMKEQVMMEEGASNVKRWLFSATPADRVPLIVQQGFNRAFTGETSGLAMHGKGVYFAREASYSTSKTYSKPDANGVQHMFACRVIVGEYCKGKKDALVPDVRDPATNDLYDSTVDNVNNPSIFVTYHDSQPYAEYLIKFREGGEGVQKEAAEQATQSTQPQVYVPEQRGMVPQPQEQTGWRETVSGGGKPMQHIEANWGSATLKFLLVGEENAGRWTIMQAIQMINLGAPNQVHLHMPWQRPGFGMALRFNVKTIPVAVIDGGGPANSSLPSQAPNVIMFVVDGTSAQEVGPARDFYENVLRRYPSARVFFLINKKDLVSGEPWRARVDAIKSGTPPSQVHALNRIHATCALDTSNIKLMFNEALAVAIESTFAKPSCCLVA
jgi:hypothetical protein